MTTYTLATPAQVTDMVKLANDWFAKSNGMFKDSRSVVIMAVAEYIANSNGLTLFQK